MKSAAVIVLLLSIPLLFPSASQAQEVPLTATELITNAVKYDGKEVFLTGEAITERLERGDYCWINVFDGSIAIGVWMDIGMSEKIKNYGTNLIKGDTVEIIGTFFRADPLADGELDVRAKELRIVAPGHPTPESIPLGKLLLMIGLGTMALGFSTEWFITQRRKQKMRRTDHPLETINVEELE